MEHENIDENARYLKACENVKKIVNAIKAIKIKYYTNFATISDEDRQVYDELEDNLERISEENNLQNLKIALMEEVSAKYDKKELKDNDNKSQNTEDDKLLACYGNVDVQQKALASGKIRQARKCQEILEKYLEEINTEGYREMVINYKREKFAELVMERVAVEEKNSEYMQYMKECFDKTDSKARKKLTEKISEVGTKQRTEIMPEMEPQL